MPIPRRQFNHTAALTILLAACGRTTDSPKAAGDSATAAATAASPTAVTPAPAPAAAPPAVPVAPARPLRMQGRWQEIGTTSSGNPVFVDPKSVKSENGIVTATVRVQFVEPVATPKGAYTSARTVAMFDCAKRVVAVKENTYYLDEKKNRIGEHKVVGKPGFGTVILGTLPDVALRHLCAR